MLGLWKNTPDKPDMVKILSQLMQKADCYDKMIKDITCILPPVETVAAAVHFQWVERERLQGVTSRKSETGEELLVPYWELSEAAKSLDLDIVQAIYDAIQHVTKE